MSKVLGIVIYENDHTEERSFDLDNMLHELYEVIGTDMVEHVTLRGGAGAYIDDEGKLKNRQVNTLATKLYGNAYDFIVGPMVIFGPADFEGNETDIGDKERELIKE